MEVVAVADGGGTKTDVAIIAVDGTTLARERLASFVPYDVGAARTAAQLDAAFRAMLEPLGATVVAVAGAYFAGIDFPYEQAEFRAQLEKYPWAQGHLLVDNDMRPLMRAGTAEDTAVAVVCGTGMNCLGWAPGGKVARFAAIGEVAGDWGGGWTIGMQAIWHAARAADGRGPQTLLESLTLQALGRASMDEVILAFHKGELRESDTKSLLTPLVFQAAAAGDEVALGVVARQAEEIVAYASAAIKRLGVGGQPCPIVLGGGIIAARPAALMAMIDQQLTAALPEAQLIIVEDPPVVGAALLAFETLGARPELLDQVRSSLRAADPARRTP
ncbi:MAG: ATPase [Propionibacteriaceae bacterium]|jgi:N-acetylglucosamine kinase-like BadF-type ATPase|nr:ATPase [Propionibacteriaceae bacterium]